LRVNDIIKIIVSEPWDFSSPEGDNVFSGKIQDQIKTSFGELYLLRVSTPFQFKTSLINWIAISRRDNHNSVNVYHINEKDVVSFKDVESIKDKLQFIIIGSIKL
jgi:hypothetical protein